MSVSKRIKLFPVLSLFIMLSSCAGSYSDNAKSMKTDLESDNIFGFVKRIELVEYGEFDTIFSTMKYDSLGYVREVITNNGIHQYRKLNKENKLIKTLNINSEGDTVSQLKNEYSNGNLNRTMGIINLEVVNEWKYLYYPDGRKKRIVILHDDKEAARYEYSYLDDKNEEIVKVFREDNALSQEISTINYGDSVTELVSKFYMKKSLKSTMKQVYYYDAYQNYIKIINAQDQDTLSTKYYQYEFDIKNNWLVKSEVFGDSTIVKARRKIEYY